MKKNYQKPSVKVVKLKHRTNILYTSPGTHDSMGRDGVQFSRGSRNNDWDDDE